jgi:hypothetical protein
MQQLTIAWEFRRDKAAVARRHELEKRLQELESLPRASSRTREIKKLREELAGG